MPMQVQITAITNGWIVSHPPLDLSSFQGGQQVMPHVQHFSTMEKVAEYLKNTFPSND